MIKFILVINIDGSLLEDASEPVLKLTYCVFVCVCVYTCGQGICGEVRGQLIGLVFSSHLAGPQDQIQVIRPVKKHLYPPIPFMDPD